MPAHEARFRPLWAQQLASFALEGDLLTKPEPKPAISARRAGSLVVKAAKRSTPAGSSLVSSQSQRLQRERESRTTSKHNETILRKVPLTGCEFDEE